MTTIENMINQVIQGDCLEVMKDIPANSVDLVITDPPYGINIGSMNFVNSGAVKVGGAYRNDYTSHNTDWDKNTLNEEYIKEIIRISKNQIIFGANYFANLLPNTKGWIVWDKRTEDKYSNDFADCELIWSSFDKPAKIIRYLWSGMLQDNMKFKDKRYHPTQKPEEVIRRMLKMFTEEGDLILDCFLGSGTTAVACKQLNRNFIGIELDEKYCQIARERISKVPKRLDKFIEGEKE